MDTQANSETFLNLLSVVRENRAEREKMLSILGLEATRRKIAINILVTEMRRKNAPQDFVEAWDALQDENRQEADCKLKVAEVAKLESNRRDWLFLGRTAEVAEVETSEVVWRNFPPAFVYRCTR